jgi:glycogen debranching enzyme-like protein
LLVVNTRGECAEDQRLTGYYFRETRFLRTLGLRINGHTPWSCEAAAISRDTLAFTYIHPEITTPGGGGTGQSGDEENPDRDGVPERAARSLVGWVLRGQARGEGVHGYDAYGA